MFSLENKGAKRVGSIRAHILHSSKNPFSVFIFKSVKCVECIDALKHIFPNVSLLVHSDAAKTFTWYRLFILHGRFLTFEKICHTHITHMSVVLQRTVH